MSIEEVKKAYPSAISPVEPSKLSENICEGLRISKVTYLGEEFMARFYFGKGGLDQVTLELKKKPEDSKMVKLAKRVAADLSKRHGEPSGKLAAKDATGASFEVIWVTPEQKISILVISMGPTESLYQSLCFNINYQNKEK